MNLGITDKYNGYQCLFHLKQVYCIFCSQTDITLIRKTLSSSIIHTELYLTPEVHSSVR